MPRQYYTSTHCKRRESSPFHLETPPRRKGSVNLVGRNEKERTVLGCSTSLVISVRSAP